MQTRENNRETRIPASVLIALGFGCLIGYVRMCSIGFLTYLYADVTSAIDPWYPLRVGVSCALLALLAFAGRERWFNPGMKSLMAGGVCAIAAVFVFAVDSNQQLGAAVAVIGSVGMSLLMFAWMLFLSSLGAKAIVRTVLFGLPISMLLVIGGPALGTEVGLVLAVFSAFACTAVLVRIDPDLATCVPDGALDASTRARVPWLTIMMVAICGFFASVLLGVAEYLALVYNWRPNYPIYTIATVAAIVATAAIMERSTNWTYVAWLPLFTLFVCAIAFACLPIDGTIGIALACMMATVFAASFLYWMVFPALFSTLQVPHAFLAGMLLACLGSGFPTLMGDALGSALPLSMRNLSSISGLMALVVALLFAALFVSNRNRVGTVGIFSVEQPALEGAREQDEIVDEPETRIDQLKESLDRLASQYGLTPRESEVALFTVQGFSCTYIAEKLVVSTSTIRFHQQNIYRKFDVHSRNELIEAVSGQHMSAP